MDYYGHMYDFMQDEHQHMTLSRPSGPYGRNHGWVAAKWGHDDLYLFDHGHLVLTHHADGTITLPTEDR